MDNTEQSMAVEEKPEAALPWLGHPALHIFIIMVLGFVAYSNTFQVPFIFDDISSIVDNPVITNLQNFLGSAGYDYNPRRFIGYLTFALNYKFGGFDVAGYHVVNLAIHLITACLVYWFVLLVLRTPFFGNQQSGTGDRGPGNAFTSPFTPSTTSTTLSTSSLRAGLHPSLLLPLLVALLFVAHPIQTQAVTYIVQRLASLAAMLYLMTLTFYLKGRLGDIAADKALTARGVLWYVLALASALLALRTKENSFTLPLIILLIEFSFFRGGPLRKLIMLVPAALFTGALAFWVLTTSKPLGVWLSDVSANLSAASNITRSEYPIVQLRVLTTYIRLLLFPVGQNLDHDYPFYRSLFEPPVFLSLLFLLALLGLAAYLYYRTRQGSGTGTAVTDPRSPVPDLYRLIAFGILWFFITLLVESSIIPIADFIFEHRLYLPSVGPFMVVAVLAMQAARRFSPRLVLGVAGFVVLLLTVATWQRNQVWQSPLSLWSDVVTKSPQTVRGRFALAMELNKIDRVDDALVQLEAALAAIKYYNYPAPYIANLNEFSGFIYNRKGMIDKAHEHLQLAVKLDGTNINAHSNLGLVLGKMGKFDESIEQSLLALKLKPEFAEPHKNLGTAYLSKGMLPEAVQHLERAVAIDPTLVEAHNNLGAVMMQTGRIQEAVEKFKAALLVQPDNEAIKGNLAVALEELQKRGK